MKYESMERLINIDLTNNAKKYKNNKIIYM